MMTPMHKEIGPDVQQALGAVVSEECQRLKVTPLIIARRGDFEF